MKRIATLTTALALTLAFSVSAFAQNEDFEVRPFSMGGPKMNNILKSHSNIWLYPQTISMYTNQAEGVIDAGGDFARFGVHYEFGSSAPFTLGIYVNNNIGFNPYPAAADWDGTAPFGGATPDSNNTLDVFYGRDMNGNPFGVHLQVHNSSTEVDGVSKQSLTSFGLDVGMTTQGGAWDWAASLQFTTHTEEVGAIAVTEPDGNLAFGLRARRWWPSNSTTAWVGHFAIGYDKVGVKTPANPPATAANTEEFSGITVDLGMGLNYTPTSKVHALLDFGIDFSTSSHEFDDSANGLTAGGADVDESDGQFSIPPYYAIGFDAEVLSWLDLRMGASNFRQGLTTEDNLDAVANPKETRKLNDVATYLGVGMHFGDLTLDAAVNPAWVNNGPNFVSGATTANMFATVAATYNFGN